MKQTLRDKLRLASKGKKIALISTAALLVLAGSGFAFYQNQEAQVKAEQIAKDKAEAEKKAKEEAAKEAEAAEKARLLTEAEDKVKALEKKQVTENIDPAQAAVNQVADASKKANLQKRIDLVKLNMAHLAEKARLLTEAESKVKALEDNQVTENVDPAQAAVNQVADADKKGALQHRIELVKEAISVRAAQAQAQAQAAAASQAASSSWSGTSGYTAPTADTGSYTAPATDSYSYTSSYDPSTDPNPWNRGDVRNMTQEDNQAMADWCAREFNNRTYDY